MKKIQNIESVVIFLPNTVQYFSFPGAENSPLIFYDIFLCDVYCSVNIGSIVGCFSWGEVIRKGVNSSSLCRERPGNAPGGRIHTHNSLLPGEGRVTNSAFSIQPYIFVPFIILSTHWVPELMQNNDNFYYLSMIDRKVTF